jgi:hypothetical protein
MVGISNTIGIGINQLAFSSSGTTDNYIPNLIAAVQADGGSIDNTSCLYANYDYTKNTAL